jgi:tRNA (adenine57-N1/adenine58-N1)-methyltransferase
MSRGKKTPIILMSEKGEKFTVCPGEGMREINGIGVVDTNRLSGDPTGSKITIADEEYLHFEASLLDILTNLERGPQLIMPKDSAQIIVGCSIGPGKTVLEIGTGTGAMTIMLAYYVRPDGRVVTYEKNDAHSKIALKNIKSAGLDDIVEIRCEDAINIDIEGEFDAVVMDIPQPWDLLESAGKTMKGSGHVCAYVPTMNQVENTIRSMRESGYIDIRSVENLQREIVVGKGGTRPSFEMLGHTGYLCFGRMIKA